MKKILFIAFCFLGLNLGGQPASRKELALMDSTFIKYYTSNDFIKAENTLLGAFKLGPLSSRWLHYIYNNLGVVYQHLGRFQDALESYRIAEQYGLTVSDEKARLASAYYNMGLIYITRKEYAQSVQYLEKSIRLLDGTDYLSLEYLSQAYAGLGMKHFLTSEFTAALDYFNKCYQIRVDNRIGNEGDVLVNIARTYAAMHNYEKADLFFRKGIDATLRLKGERNFILAEEYFAYGKFLSEVGRDEESVIILKKALNICLELYGTKHTLTSLAFKNLGDSYTGKRDYRSALRNYQNALISVSSDFGNADIFTNPGIDSSLFNLRLLDDLKSKAYALELLAGETVGQDSSRFLLENSLKTINLALDLIEKIRSNAMSESDKLFLAENEKPSYISALRILSRLYSLSASDSLLTAMYDVAQLAKSSVLKNELAENNLLYSPSNSENVRARYKELSQDIAAYTRFISNSDPSSPLIPMWKDALFEMNRQLEDLTGEILRNNPGWKSLFEKTRPVPASLIKEKLEEDVTLIDYIVSPPNDINGRKLYIFLLTSKNLHYCEVNLDEDFVRDAEVIKKINDPSFCAGKDTQWIEDYAGALHRMYVRLVKPVENQITGDRILIIADEEIECLPFDAFIRNPPGKGISDFEGLDFLVKEYSFFYNYSSSLLIDLAGKPHKGCNVLSFSPSYDNNGGSGPDALTGAIDEIGTIHRRFGGKMYSGNDATKSRFTGSLAEPSIFHLAMHLMTDSLNSSFSYLLFNPDSTDDDGRLYNYEVSLQRMQSPMVVLSACNSGTGTIHSGSEQMSMARSFILAGASSVVKTAWAVNDESSSDIIKRYYLYLSKGMKKDKALRRAKLDFIEKSSPAYANPYYWAAYQLLGNSDPVEKCIKKIVTFVTISSLLTVVLVLYLRRRRIFSARSL